MIEDLNKFSLARKASVQNWYTNLGYLNGDDKAVAMAAVFSGCPNVVVTYWIAEVAGWNEVLTKHLRSVVNYYGYTDIFNTPENSPNIRE